MKYFLILMLGSLFLFSCGKKRMIKVSAINPATGEGYAYLPFKVTSSKSVFMETQYKTEYEGELDENGQAAFELRQKNSRSYSIATSTPNDDGSLPCYINDASMSFSKPGTNYNFQFEYAPCAYRTLKIENVNCEGVDDLFELDMRLLYDEDHTVFSFSPKSGCYSNQFNNEKVPAGKWVVEWWVTRSSNTNHFTDTIYISKNESFTYEINY
ncbi:MAG: hypothetical protein WEA99_13655 [Brumimicrobium sp.]